MIIAAEESEEEKCKRLEMEKAKQDKERGKQELIAAVSEAGKRELYNCVAGYHCRVSRSILRLLQRAHSDL
jgi:hypothetical protein